MLIHDAIMYMTTEEDLQRAIEGLFPRDTWLRLMRDAGFEPRVVVDPYEREVFVGIRRES